jgi:hydroxymethylpyrimidine pyrophosphatase-like HAD family hydrolase
MSKIISFDFDGTIQDHFGGKEYNQFKFKVQDLIKRLIEEGYDVHIVTRRFSPEWPEQGLMHEHVFVYETATELGVNHANVHFTNRSWKWQTLEDLGVHFHLDDDKEDIFHINMYCKTTKGHLLNSEDAVESFYNLFKE